MIVSPHPQGLLGDREFRLLYALSHSSKRPAYLSSTIWSLVSFVHIFIVLRVFFHCSQQKHLFSSSPLRNAPLQLTGMLL